MKAIRNFLAGGVAIAALTAAAPVAAQYYPGYGNPGYGNPGYGYANPGYGVNSQAAVSQCTAAVQARLNGGYGYAQPYGGGYGGGRVLGVSRVEPRGDGVTVRGVASSGRAGAYGYGYGYNQQQQPDLTWRCRTDFRGYVIDVDVRAARPAYGNYNRAPYNNGYGNDYSQYGYRRY